METFSILVKISIKKKIYQPNQIQDRKTKQSRLRDDSDKARSRAQ